MNAPTPTTRHNVRRATVAETDPLVAVLARAFDDDPFVDWFVRDGPERRARVARYFRINLALAFRGGEVYTARGFQGAALWITPGQWQPGTLDQLGWLPDMVRIAGVIGLFTRVLSVMRAERSHPETLHYYLLALGTDPAYQGKGIGPSLMAPVLRRCDAEGVPAYLETPSQDLVPFYEEQGFAVHDTLDLPFAGPTLWQMWRPPQGNRAPLIAGGLASGVEGPDS